MKKIIDDGDIGEYMILTVIGIVIISVAILFIVYFTSFTLIVGAFFALIYLIAVAIRYIDNNGVKFPRIGVKKDDQK